MTPPRENHGPGRLVAPWIPAPTTRVARELPGDGDSDRDGGGGGGTLTAEPAEISPEQLLALLEPPTAPAPAGGPPGAAPNGGGAGADVRGHTDDRADGSPGTVAPDVPGDPTAPPALVDPPGLRHRLQRHRNGVAPFVRPSARRSRRKRRHDYRQLGFVELTPEKLRLRHRVLPRTVLGMSLMILCLGVGAAFAGAAFYAYYDWRTSQSEAQSIAFAEGFEQTFTGAQEQLQLTRNDAIEEIDRSLEPLRRWTGDGNAVVELPKKIGGGVLLVRTLDTAGRTSVGSAFVVASEADETLLLTSYQVVAASAAKPAPGLTVQKGGDSFRAELVAWDEQHDLALLRVGRGGLPTLEWAGDEDRAATIGTRVYAVSGSGGQGATASPGLAVDASEAGIRHDAPLGPEFRGAPLTDAEGKVLGVVSTAYRPAGIEVGELPFSPFVTESCRKVLRCPSTVTDGMPTAPAQTSGGSSTPTTGR